MSRSITSRLALACHPPRHRVLLAPLPALLLGGVALGVALSVALCVAPRAAGAQGAQSTPAATPENSAHFWQSEDGTAVFDVAPCADTAPGRAPRVSLCGRLAWAKEGAGRPDAKNPDAALRTRPLCNTVVVGGFAQESPQSWKDGWVYDWNSGKRYKTNLAFTSDSTAELRVRYGVMRFTDTWRRVAAPPARCEG